MLWARFMQKCVFWHMPTPKVQISLPIRAVWSGHLPSAHIIIGYYRMYEWRAKVQMILCACTGWSESAFYSFSFSLDEVLIIVSFRHLYSKWLKLACHCEDIISDLEEMYFFEIFMFIESILFRQTNDNIEEENSTHCC